MKKVYLSAMAAVLVCMTAFSQSHYNGNNNTGFGGVVGPGSLDISNDAVNLIFQFNRTTSNFSNKMDNPLVIYIDAGIGGFSSTSTFTDVADGLRKAVSGFTLTDQGGLSGRATYNFFTSTTADSNFTPEFALAFQPGDGSAGTVGLYALQSNGLHTLIPGTVFTPNNNALAASYTILVPLAALPSLGTNVNFKFVATYISNTGYRSDEAIGDPFTGFSQGWNPYTETKHPLYYPSGALPVTFGNIAGSLQNKSVSLSWNVLSETNTKSYLVQKSADGSSFATIATLASQNRNTGAAYTYVDNGQINAKNYYRIVAVDMDGRQTTSRVISIADVIGSATVKAYFSGNTLNIKMSNPAAAKYEFALYSSNGQKIASTVYQHPGGESATTLSSAAGLPKGIYYLSVQSGSDRKSIRLFNQ